MLRGEVDYGSAYSSANSIESNVGAIKTYRLAGEMVVKFCAVIK